MAVMIKFMPESYTIPMGVGPPFIVAFTPIAWAILGADKATANVNRIVMDAIEIDTIFRFLISVRRFQCFIN